MCTNIQQEIQAQFAHIPNAVCHDVPYICQYARPKDVERFKTKKLSPAQDPYWKKTGASSLEEYEKWTHALCGMAATLMLLKYFKRKNIKLITLAKDALRNKVYHYEPSGCISNMQYREFTKWIGKYGLHAEISFKLSLKRIKYALANNKFPIVSVNPNIGRHQTLPTRQKGGHLVLMTGYNLINRTLSLNNSTGFYNLNTQKQHKIFETEFRKYYTGKGIIVSQI